jgi:hypothetical protein
MDATTYTGNGSTQSIVNNDLGTVGFKPDLVWVKSRSNGEWHILGDSVRGTGKSLFSNRTDAEYADGYTAFNSNGFGVNTWTGTNGSGYTYVGWQWQAGQGTTSSNTSGSITSTVSVNASAGFSIVTYTGNGTSGATVGHGLGVAPSMVITKCRSNTNTFWQTYHASLGNTKVVYLNATDASATSSASWNNTSPTSTVFSLGNGSDGNGSTFTYVAYCWAPVAGFSQFGSYVGNGSADGSFVYLGFRPSFIMVKNITQTGNWEIYDTSRNLYNQTYAALYANLAATEDSSNVIDILSNGFKLRNTSQNTNTSGDTFIYACFAENPFKFSNAR